MNHSSADYLLYYLAKLLSIFLRRLPVQSALFIGRRIGLLFSVLNRKRYRIAYANLKSAFSNTYKPAEIKKILKQNYANIGQGVVDAFLLPKINNAYIKKYITYEDFHIAEEIISRGQGLIFLTAHFGTWEISHAALPYKNLFYKGIAREQKPYLLNSLLNTYRQSHGCKIIMKGPAVRDALRTLKTGGIVGMLVDQDAGKNGIFTDLFNRPASWHRGVMEMAVKLNAAVVPGFAIRENGPYVKFKVFKPLILDRQLSLEQAAREGLAQYARILEGIVKEYPHQWLWQHRRWKSTTVRDVIILNDGKAGHLRQSESIAELLRDIWVNRGYSRDGIRVKVIDVKYRVKIARWFLSAKSTLSRRFCQGCLKCLRFTLLPDSYEEISKNYADIIISCGSSTAAVNLLLSRENNAKSVVLMRPALVSLKHFNLAIIPEHDKPCHASNTIFTRAALNLANKENIECSIRTLKDHIGPINKKTLGILIGGDTKHFQLKCETIKYVVEAALKIGVEYDAEILVSTSRRTVEGVEYYLKDKLSSEPRCRFLVIANEYNPRAAAEAIINLSDILLVSEDSVSMISESASCEGYRIVFRQGNYTNKRHNRFLNNLETLGYIETTEYTNSYASIKKALDLKLKQPVLDDSIKVREALERVL
jgi:Kdo2-lipid IVA lauroyltransferase/acyltransferase